MVVNMTGFCLRPFLRVPYKGWNEAEQMRLCKCPSQTIYIGFRVDARYTREDFSMQGSHFAIPRARLDAFR